MDPLLSHSCSRSTLSPSFLRPSSRLAFPEIIKRQPRPGHNQREQRLHLPGIFVDGDSRPDTHKRVLPFVFVPRPFHHRICTGQLVGTDCFTFLSAKSSVRGEEGCFTPAYTTHSAHIARGQPILSYIQLLAKLSGDHSKSHSHHYKK